MLRSRWNYLAGLCGLALLAVSARGDDWPQWLGPKRDGVWRETGILKKFPTGGPKRLWRTPIGAGYAGPAVAGGKVYVTDRILAEGARNPKNSFSRDAVAGNERVLCLDEKSGEILWKHEYDCPYQVSYASGPRTTPVVAGGKVYTLGTMGDLLCLDAERGKVLWSKNFPRDFKAPVPLWGFSSSPLLDGNRLVCLVGGKGSAAVAFDKDTGAEVWRALSTKQIGYAPPVLIEAGGKRQLIIWHPEAVSSLNPETGAVYWSIRYPKRGELGAGMSIPTPRFANGKLFLTSFYGGSLMLKLDPDRPAAEEVWQAKGRGVEPEVTEALQSVMVTPVLKNGYIYGVCSYGELRCLKADTGERVWMTRAPTSGGPPLRWGNAFIIAQGDRYFLFNEKGDLIIARLSPKGYEEVGRANILAPTNNMAPPAGRLVLWSHPAFADRCIFARNDREIVCVSLAVK
jgi:outer membrane protein assembly factor BamB